MACLWGGVLTAKAMGLKVTASHTAHGPLPRWQQPDTHLVALEEGRNL